MAEFLCKVADGSGKVFLQIEPAESVAEARQKLADRGLFVYNVRPRAGVLGQLFGRKRQKSVDGNDFLVFNQQFNTLIKAGIPILKALDLLSERAAAERLRPVLGEVRRLVREGTTLSEALEQQGVFPKVYTVSVLAGEKSGNLSGVLEYYITYQRVTTGFRRKLISTLIYPVILIAVTVTYRPYLLSAIALLFLFAAAVYAWSQSEQGGMAMERVRMGLPLIGETITKFQFAQFCCTLSTLLAGGTPLVQALETAGGAIRSRLISGAITHGAQLVREGQSLHNSLVSTGLVPDLALEMIEVGEASGSLSPMLASVAEFYEDDVNTHLANLVALIEPAILIFMAILIAFILVALYLPMFSLSVGGQG